MPHSIRNARPSAPTETLNITDFSGGLNLRDDDFELAPNETPNCLNVDFNPRGGFELRGGVTEFVDGTEVYDDHDSAHTSLSSYTNVEWDYLSTFHKLFEFKQYYGATPGDEEGCFLMTVPVDDDQTGRRYLNELWLIKDDGSKTQLQISSNNCIEGPLVDGVEWEQYFFLVSGHVPTGSTPSPGDPSPTIYVGQTGTPTRADVAGYSTSSTNNFYNDYSTGSGAGPGPYIFPSARYCDVHQSYMWAAYIYEKEGVASTFSVAPKNNRIRWSHPSDPWAWAENDYIDIDPDRDGDFITGIVSYNDILVVFKNNAMYAVTGYDRQTFSVVNISEDVGCAGSNGFVKTPHGLFFFHERTGMWVYDGKNLQNVFGKLAPIVETGANGGPTFFVRNTVDSRYRWPASCLNVGYHDDLVWLSGRETAYATGTHTTHFPTDTTYVFSVKTGAWTKYDFGVSACIESSRIENAPTLYGIIDAGFNTAQVAMAVVRLHQNGQPYDEFWQNLASTADSGTNSYSTMKRGRINAHWASPWFFADNPAQDKRWKRPTYYLNADDSWSTTVFIYSDWDAYTSTRNHNVSSTQILGGESSHVTRGSSLGKAKAVKLYWLPPSEEATHTDNPHWGVDGISLKFVRKAVR